VLVKLNSEDFVEGGFSVEEMLDVAAELERHGVDAIELSGGTLSEGGRYTAVRPGVVTPEKEGYYRDAARRLKARVGLPLILVGGIRSPEVAERLLADGVADYLALCRPLICEPDLVARWRAGDRRRSACLSDNRCFRPAMSGEGLRCLLWDE
jgi:2,4-dienoyl-CoA reductase-like NADH-dependent reductase (Old Yellow Enzyme family)